MNVISRVHFNKLISSGYLEAYTFLCIAVPSKLVRNVQKLFSYFLEFICSGVTQFVVVVFLITVCTFNSGLLTFC